MSTPRPGGGWPTAAPPPSAPSIDYWKQHQHHQLQQQQLQYQQHTQLQQPQRKCPNHVQQQQQQQVAWCEPSQAAAATAADGQCNNYVTTVMVAGLQVPASPRCESARSDAAESSCSSLSQESLSPPARLAVARSVAAPEGWNRVTSNGLVVYVSPSGASLTSGEEARQYLRTAGTCKCGLECPIRVEKSFNFDPKVITRPRSTVTGAAADSPSETTKTCNHRRKRAELLQRRAAGKDVPPTFQEQRCNPHNNPFFRDQMLQAMEQMGYRQQQQHHQLHHHQQHQQRPHQHQQQQLGLMMPAGGPRWPAAGVTAARLPAPAPPPHLLRAHWDELRRRRAAGRGRRRASPCPNVDVRQLPAAAAAERSTPSFMEDPSGYLARQTQLLNDTMQEGLSPVPAPPPAPTAEVPLPSTVLLPARVGKHAPAETSAATESPPASDASPAGAAAVPGCAPGGRSAAAAAGGTPERPAAESPVPAWPDPAQQPAESSQTESPLTPADSGVETDRAGEAAAVSSADDTQRQRAAEASRQATGPALAPVPTSAQYQPAVGGGGEVPLVQSLPAGQIILPSGQVILTQPFQPMLQYVNAFPMQQPLVVPAGGTLLQSQPAEPGEQAAAAAARETPTGRRRKRRQPPSVAAMLQRSQQQAGLQTLLMSGAGGAAAAGGAGKQQPVVLGGGQPGGVNFLQPVLLPGGGGQLFIQSVGGPLLSTSLAGGGQTGGQLLQVVSVMGDQCRSSLPPPPPPPPAAEQQTRMAADSSTSGHASPDAGGDGGGGSSGGGGGGSPGPQEEPVSSTGEPPDEPPPPAKRSREATEDGEPEPAFCAGDLVWGSHHGLCSWPGQVVERSDVQACEPSQVWVQWFGDHTMSLESVEQLRKFHDHGTSKRNKSAAENSSFEEALKEALTAVERQRK